MLAKKALELYRLKGVEITEEIALLFVKACCRIGSSPSAAWPPPPHAAEGESEGGEGDGVADADAGDGAEAGEAGLALFPFGRSGGAAALATLLDPTMRVGLWSNATAWNYALARLDGKPGSLPPPLPLETVQPGAEGGAEEGSEGEGQLSSSSSSESAEEEEERGEAEGGGGESAAVAAAAEEDEEVVAARRVLVGFEHMTGASGLGVAPNGHTYHLVARALLVVGGEREGSSGGSKEEEGGGGVAKAKDIVERARRGACCGTPPPPWSRPPPTPPRGAPPAVVASPAAAAATAVTPSTRTGPRPTRPPFHPAHRFS